MWLLAVNPVGVITGLGFGAASTKDQPLAETFFAARHRPHPALLCVGAPAKGPYLTDKGFEAKSLTSALARGLRSGRHLCPQEQQPSPLAAAVAAVAGTPAPDRRNRQWVPASHLPPQPRASPCPRWLPSTPGRLKAALHNFCIWLNEQLGRPRLAFADLIAW
jgi:hypothetical protein